MAKFLCVCDRGNVRSYALSLALKRRKHEAIAIGRFTVSAPTLGLLCAWADRIVVMEPHMRESLPEAYREDSWCVDVGPDRWGARVDPELAALVEEGVDLLPVPELLTKHV